MIRIERVGAVFTAILLLCSVLSTSASARLSRSRQVPNSTGEIFFLWDAESTIPPVTTAIETTGWGQIKLLLEFE